jgi:hypothetical protein
MNGEQVGIQEVRMILNGEQVGIQEAVIVVINPRKLIWVLTSVVAPFSVMVWRNMTFLQSAE